MLCFRSVRRRTRARGVLSAPAPSAPLGASLTTRAASLLLQISALPLHLPSVVRRLLHPRLFPAQTRFLLVLPRLVRGGHGRGAGDGDGRDLAGPPLERAAGDAAAGSGRRLRPRAPAWASHRGWRGSRSGPAAEVSRTVARAGRWRTHFREGRRRGAVSRRRGSSACVGPRSRVRGN